MQPLENSEALTTLLNEVVVLDLVSSYVCVGTLIEIDQLYYVLETVDVHDLRDTNTTRELYVLETKLHGVRANRKRALIARREVIGVTALRDVME